MSPLTDDEYNADLAADFGFPLIVVAANVLGTINHTLQTLIAAAAFGNGLPVAGVVLNDIGDSPVDISTASNLNELKARCVSPVLGQVSFAAQAFAPQAAWQNLASGPEADEEDEEKAEE
jgi:dethiobiotin synthetase